MNNKQLIGCFNEEVVVEKEIAKKLIVGKWHWQQTIYSSRGAETTVKTPATTNKTIDLLVTNRVLHWYENDSLVLTQGYEIEFWDEGTTTVSLETLVVIYVDLVTGRPTGRSILSLSKAGVCLTLIDSYDDAGGDTFYQKAE